MKIPCVGCHISCCSEYAVLVSFFDIYRIGATLGLPLAEFSGFVPLVQENIDYDPYAFSLGGEDKFILALKKKGKSCIFLLPFPSGGRCGIHSCRPNVCRCYPFSFERGRLEEIHQMLCPEKWELNPEEVKRFAGYYRQLKTDYFLYQAFIETWNCAELPALMKSGERGIHGREGFDHFLAFMQKKVDEGEAGSLIDPSPIPAKA